MYEEFRVTDSWSGDELDCRWKSTVVAIATRHANAVDVCFEANGRALWVALPLEAWKKHKSLTGKVITDQIAAQIAGRFLKKSIEDGADARREIRTMTVDEVLSHLDAVVAEAKQCGEMPTLPVLTEDTGIRD